MTNLKTQIITAFEDLDAGLLEILLSEDLLYQQMTKKEFVNGFKNYFNEVRERDSTPFKAYVAKSDKQDDNSKGYSFVNRFGVCYLSLIFMQIDEEILNIYQHWHLTPIDIEVKSSYDMQIFYLDQKYDYIENEDKKLLKKMYQKAVDKITYPLAEDGFLKKNYYTEWFTEYYSYFDFDAFRNGQIYSFQKQFYELFWSIENIIAYSEKEEEAHRLLQDFLSIPVVTKDFIKEWISQVDNAFPIAIAGFNFVINYRQKIFYCNDLIFDFEDLFYAQNVAYIRNFYQHIILLTEHMIAGAKDQETDNFPY